MDEVHLHVEHGLSFREDVRKLKDIFFLPVFQPRDERQCKPCLLALTATMTKSLYPGLEYLTACKFTDDPHAIQRGSCADFRQENIRMTQHVINKKDYVRVGLDPVIDFLKSNTSRKVCVFTNSVDKCIHFHTQLEKKLNEAGITCDVILIHGGLNKSEKFWRVRFFCGSDSEFVEGLVFRCLMV
jgi:superfamily II DNA helicase RecQ